MINNDRIVPVTATDLITLYGTVFNITNNVPELPAVINAADTAGDFIQATNSATVLASEPVKTFNFGSGVTAGTVFFVPAYDYAGFQINGTATTTTGATVAADGRTLYKATLSSGTITIVKVGF